MVKWGIQKYFLSRMQNMAVQPSYKKIIVPLDGSGWSQRAIPHAAEIARHHGAELILLHVFKPPASEYADQLALAGQEDQIQHMREQIKQQLISLRNQLRGEKIDVTVQVIEGAGVAHLICDYINTSDADLVVMSTHGRTGMARFLFGSIANKVVQDVQVPVMLIRPDRD
jgi:nucleotide-binding universal stress UspA family protein